MEGTGSATMNSKHQEEEETSPNRNQLITNTMADELALSLSSPTKVIDPLH